MSHEIDTTTGQAACLTVGEPAWHKLGVNVQEAPTSAEAIKLAGLDWRVDQMELTRQDGTVVSSHVANVRSDTKATLGIVGAGYRPFQNAEAFGFMDAIVGDKLAIWETAGSLFGGRKVWMLARLPKTLRVADGDELKPYALISNAHDGSRMLRIFLTTVRVVCNNTHRLAMSQRKSGEGLAIRHRGGLEGFVADARKKLGVVLTEADHYEDLARCMARRSMTRDELREYFCALVEDKSAKQQERLLATFAANFEGVTNWLPGIRGSLWAAFNAVTEFADWQTTIRGKGEVLDNARLNSIWFGAAHDLKSQAWNLAVAMAS